MATGPGFVRVSAGEPATISDAKWEQRAEELSFQALPNVRSIAEKWTGTIASILAIFGIVTLVKGPEDVTKVEGSLFGVAYETWVLILLGLAVFCAVAATVSAASAAYGQPKDLRFVGEEVRRLYRDDAKNAAKKLRISRWLSLAAVTSLALAVGITWLKTPEQPAEVGKILVIGKSGIRACGELQASRGGGNVRILEQGAKTPQTVPVGEIVSVAAVASCPGAAGPVSTSKGTVLTTIHWNNGATQVFPAKQPLLVDTAGNFTKRDEKTRLRVTWQGLVAMKAPTTPSPAGGAGRFSLCVFFLKIDKLRGSVERVIQGHPGRLAVYAPTLVDFFDKVPAGKHTVTIWASAPFHNAPLCSSNSGGNPETIFVEEMPT